MGAITELYLFRHSEAEMNRDARRISGRSNESPLTPLGIEQSKQLGRYMLARGIIPSRVFSSPAIRALDTATYALEAMGLAIELAIDDDLQELYQGDWEGRSWSSVISIATLDDIVRYGKDFQAPGRGESLNQGGARMLDCANSIAAGNTVPQGTERVFAFSHGLAIRSLASTLCGWGQVKTFKSVTDNASFTLLTHQDDQWRLEYLGRNPE